MRLKYARLIELSVRIIAMIVTSPIWVLGTVAYWVSKINDAMLDIVGPLLNIFGKWLLRHTKEAKEGMFSEECLYGRGIYNTAYAYKDLKNRQKNEKN